MPISRQISITNAASAQQQPRRHRQRSQSPSTANCNVGSVSAHPRYGSLVHKTSNASSDRRQHVTKLNAIPPIHDESESDEHEEERPALKPQTSRASEDSGSTSSSSSYTRFSELTRKEWATIGMLGRYYSFWAQVQLCKISSNISA
jgi:hypothetical protein